MAMPSGMARGTRKLNDAPDPVGFGTAGASHSPAGVPAGSTEACALRRVPSPNTELDSADAGVRISTAGWSWACCAPERWGDTQVQPWALESLLVSVICSTDHSIAGPSPQPAQASGFAPWRM